MSRKTHVTTSELQMYQYQTRGITSITMSTHGHLFYNKTELYGVALPKLFSTDPKGSTISSKGVRGYSPVYTPLFYVAQKPKVGHRLLVVQVSRSHQKDAPQSVGLLWTVDQPVTETSTRKHSTIRTGKHSCPRWDSNLQTQQASDRRPAP